MAIDVSEVVSLKDQGLSQRAIAEKLNTNQWAIGKVLRTPEQKAEFAKKRKEYFKRLRESDPAKYRAKDVFQYHKHRETILTHARIRAKANKAKWTEIIKERGMDRCSICGYDRCFSAIDFHHVNPEEKRWEVGTFLQSKVSPERIQELEKCIAVCRNCHAEIHAKETINTNI